MTAGAPGSIVQGNRPDDRRLISSFSVNGQTDTMNNNMIDGMDNNERIIGTIGVRPSIDAVQELNVQTNKYDASVGRTGGGVVDVITKSGTNSLHGSAYEFFRNKVLNANPNWNFNEALNLAQRDRSCTPRLPPTRRFSRTNSAAASAGRSSRIRRSSSPITKSSITTRAPWQRFYTRPDPTARRDLQFAQTARHSLVISRILTRLVHSAAAQLSRARRYRDQATSDSCRYAQAVFRR